MSNHEPVTRRVDNPAKLIFSVLGRTRYRWLYEDFRDDFLQTIHLACAMQGIPADAPCDIDVRLLLNTAQSALYQLAHDLGFCRDQTTSRWKTPTADVDLATIDRLRKYAVDNWSTDRQLDAEKILKFVQDSYSPDDIAILCAHGKKEHGIKIVAASLGVAYSTARKRSYRMRAFLKSTFDGKAA